MKLGQRSLPGMTTHLRTLHAVPKIICWFAGLAMCSSAFGSRLPVAGSPGCSMQHVRRSCKAAVENLASRGLFSGQPKRLVSAASIWHHRNPFDIDELGTKKLSEQSPLLSIDEVEHQRKRDKLGHEEAKEAAIKLLAARPHSDKELRTKLVEKGFGMELIKDALDRLHELGLQSDREFAKVFARSKWRTSKWGPAKLESELARRGVAREHITAAVQHVFGEGLQVEYHIEDLSAEPHATTMHGATAGQHRADAAEANPAGALLAEARRRFEGSGGLAMESRKRRLVGWLQRRGHRWEDISKILKQLEKEAAAAALDAEEDMA